MIGIPNRIIFLPIISLFRTDRSRSLKQNKKSKASLEETKNATPFKSNISLSSSQTARLLRSQGVKTFNEAKLLIVHKTKDVKYKEMRVCPITA